MERARATARPARRCRLAVDTGAQSRIVDEPRGSLRHIERVAHSRWHSGVRRASVSGQAPESSPQPAPTAVRPRPISTPRSSCRRCGASCKGSRLLSPGVRLSTPVPPVSGRFAPHRGCAQLRTLSASFPYRRRQREKDRRVGGDAPSRGRPARLGSPNGKSGTARPRARRGHGRSPAATSRRVAVRVSAGASPLPHGPAWT